MNNNTLMTYSLLSHIKETHNSELSSIVELFFPLVKKSIVEYANEKGNVNVKGKSLTEIQSKINEYFGIDMPPSVLDLVLTQIKKEISDERIFSYNTDKSFIINSFAFSEIDNEIEVEHCNVQTLKSDYIDFCSLHNSEPEFDELIKFICSQKIDLFANKNSHDLNFEYLIPKYISIKFNDPRIFKIISDIYLGSLISSYFEFNIRMPVSKTELLIDTNFFISLIDLNTHEAYLTCNQLFELCIKLGFKFSILYCTIEQIKVLLSSRINDYANKEVGLIKDADIFGACIRRNLDKTDLERTKDNVDFLIRKLGIDIIHEPRIKEIITKAKNSDKYKELLVIRNHQKLSALNDTIAHFYVQSKRGEVITEFADVKCWFLNNSFYNESYSHNGYKIHDRLKINANELLSLLWLSNPSQSNIDITTIARGGLATYIAKFRTQKVPSIKVIKDINIRAKKAIEQGTIEEHDVFAISIRMAEGQLSNGEATSLITMPDESFIEKVKTLSMQDDLLRSKISEQTKTIESQQDMLNDLIAENNATKLKLATEVYENKLRLHIEEGLKTRISKINSVAIYYSIGIVFIISAWSANHFYSQRLNPTISSLIAIILFLFPIFIRFVEHKTVYKCLLYFYSPKKKYNLRSEITSELKTEYESKNIKPC